MRQHNLWQLLSRRLASLHDVFQYPLSKLVLSQIPDVDAPDPLSEAAESITSPRTSSEGT